MRSILRAALKVLGLAVMLPAAMACSDRASPPAAVPPAVDLHDEAGFLDVPPQAHGAPYPGRMFYVFEVADVVSEGSVRVDRDEPHWYGTTSLILAWPAGFSVTEARECFSHQVDLAGDRSRAEFGEIDAEHLQRRSGRARLRSGLGERQLQLF